MAGTAGAVRHHQEQKYANQAAQQQAVYEQGVADAQATAAPAPAPVEAPVGGIDMEQLKQLGDLHAAGVLDDAEFAAAKAKILGTA
ncbi:MAG: SHOCT domain-containing protein [Chloroflexota bacterium]|nr:SHOCT domain-containing protein [Chloroflexota bacterium]MDH5244217.1 SHOCT domain-containing protein [Chloroflexota bacterium]